jgi:hypothetical protein
MAGARVVAGKGRKGFPSTWSSTFIAGGEVVGVGTRASATGGRQ